MKISTLVPVMELLSEDEEALIGLWAMELISMEIDVQKKIAYIKK